MNLQGWECPKCERVFSPLVATCTHCPAPAALTAEATADESFEAGKREGRLELLATFGNPYVASPDVRCFFCGGRRGAFTDRGDHKANCEWVEARIRQREKEVEALGNDQ